MVIAAAVMILEAKNEIGSKIVVLVRYGRLGGLALTRDAGAYRLHPYNSL